MKVLVTGATGFIGRHLTSRLLDLGHQVRILTRNPSRVPSHWLPQVEIVTGDLLDAEAVGAATRGVSTVYHLAGVVKDERLLTSVNVEGLEIVLAASAKAGVRTFCYLSSVGVYGVPRPGPVTEESPCNPQTKYQKTKLEGEHLVRGFSDAGRFQTIVVRPTIVYGEGHNQSGVFFSQWLAAIRGSRFRFLGNKAVANFVYVGDLVEACLFLVKHASRPHEVCIVSDPVPMSELVGLAADAFQVVRPRSTVPVWLAYVVAGISRIMSRVLSTPVPLSIAGVRALSAQYVFVPERLREGYHFSFPFGFHRGLERTVEWYQCHYIAERKPADQFKSEHAPVVSDRASASSQDSFLPIELEPHRLAKTTFVNLMGRSVAAIVPAVIAFLLGATHVTDSLFWVVSVVMFFGGASFVGIELLSVPLIQEIRVLGSRVVCNFVGGLSATMIPWGLAATATFGAISSLLVLWMSVAYSSVEGYTIGYLIEIIPIIFIMMLGGLWSGFLSGHGDFMAPGWAHAVRWVVVILATVLLTQAEALPLLGFVFLAGELARTSYLWSRLKREGLWGGWGSVRRSFPSVQTPVAIFGFEVLAMLAINSNVIVDKAMGSFLGPGKLSLFEYAFTLYLVPTTILSSGLLPVFFSEWSRVFYADGGRAQLRSLVRQAFWKSIVWSIPFSVGIGLTAWLLASHPFEVGKLPMIDVAETFWVIGGLALGIPGALGGLVVMRGLLVIKAVKPFLAVAICKCVVNAGLNYVLMVPLGLIGIALSTALTETVTAASLYLLFKYRMRHLAQEQLVPAEESSAVVLSA